MLKYFFSSIAHTKIDYFFFDRSLNDYIIEVLFLENFVIGDDHLPGFAKVTIPGLNEPKSAPPLIWASYKLKNEKIKQKF